MNFKTLIARYPGKCRRCGEQFPVGTRIRYGGRGATYHMAAECPKGNPQSNGKREDAALDYDEAGWDN